MSRIVLHVGYGKTGTTAIQGWLRRNRELLAEAGILHCGTTLSHLVPQGLPWTRVPELVRATHTDMAATAEIVGRALDAGAATHRTVVWSLEFLQEKQEFVSQVAGHIDPAHEIEVVIYLRNHVDWLVSAYAQWALKAPNKVNEDGSLLDFEQFRERRARALDYAGALDRWAAIERVTLNPRSYDMQDDVVSDFIDILGARDLGAQAPERRNENFGRAQLALLRTIRENGERDILYRQFGRMLDGAGAGRPLRPVDPTPVPVTDEALAALHEGFAGQRRELRERYGIEFNAAPRPNENGAVPGTDATNTDMIAALAMVCFDLHRQVQELRRQLGRAEDD